MALSGNKGEWSETYVLLNLMSSGVLQIVDEELRPTGNVMGLVAIERGSKSGLTTYRPQSKKGYVRIDGGGESILVKISDIEDCSRRILDGLTNGEIKQGIPEIEELLAKLRVAKLSAESSNKSDIRLIVQDSMTTSRLDLPMSIKSMIGSPPTLLNASGATNFEFRFNCREHLYEELESLGRKPKAVIQRLAQEEISLISSGPVNSMFNLNLRLSDSILPVLLSELVLQYYSGSRSDLLELINDLARRDPLGIGPTDADRFYTTKFRTLLSDVALGMKPSSRWDGRYVASGGYLVVKPSGEIVCLYAADRDKFRDYLLANTRLETADTKKHGFGKVERLESGGCRVLLNLQIRFKAYSGA
jgi:hypothetical protein